MSEIVENMPFDEYAKRPGVNASVRKLVHRKSLLYARGYLEGVFSEESDALDFGKCFHSLALENHEDFVTIPATYLNDKDEEKPWNWNANVCKGWAKTIGDKIPLKESEVATVRTMAGAVYRELGSLKGRAEVSLFAEMKGHPVKCRLDFLPDDHNEPIIDLKSCPSAEPRKFMRSAVELGYLLQVAFAVDVAKACGLPHKRFDLLAVETEGMHDTCRLEFNDEPLSLLRLGRIHYREAFNSLLMAEDTGLWEGYGSHRAEEFAPPWIEKEFLERTA